jgi:hypothetical protein
MKKAPASHFLSILAATPTAKSPTSKKRGRKAEVNTGVPEVDERLRAIQKRERSAPLTSKAVHSDRKLNDLPEHQRSEFLAAIKHFFDLSARGYHPGEHLVAAIIDEHKKHLSSLHDLALANAVKAEVRAGKSLSVRSNSAFEAVAKKLSSPESKISPNRVRKTYYKKDSNQD